MGMLKTAFVVAIFSVTIWWILSCKKFDPDSIRGKRVIVTGSSKGIGEELAYQYSKLGAKIIITARNENRLKIVAEKCKQLGAEQVEIVPADMTDEESRKNVVKTAKDKFGGLDVLILNHVYIDNDSVDMSRFRKMLEVAYVSYVDVANQALPLLEESKGELGVVSSIAGKIPLRSYSCYSGCKFALEGYFGALRLDLNSKKSNVSISLAFLGAIGTNEAMEYLKIKNIDTSVFASVESTALAIMKGVSTRVNDIYHPLLARILVEISKFSTSLAHQIFVYLHNFDIS